MTRYQSRFNPDVTYGCKSDRDSDDRYFARLHRECDAEIRKLKMELKSLGVDV